MRLIISGAGINISKSTALLTSIAILITNEYISKLKISYTKLRDWIEVITLLYEKTLKNSIVEKKLMNKKLTKRKRPEILKNTQFRVEDTFGVVISRDIFSQEQRIKPNSFSAKIMWI